MRACYVCLSWDNMTTNNQICVIFYFDTNLYNVTSWENIVNNYVQLSTTLHLIYSFHYFRLLYPWWYLVPLIVKFLNGQLLFEDLFFLVFLENKWLSSGRIVVIYSVPWICGALFASPVLAALFLYVQLVLLREQNTQIFSQITGTSAQFLSRPHPSIFFFFFNALWTRRIISRALHPLTSVNPFPMQSHMDTCNDNESFTCFTFTSTSFVGRTFCKKETQEKPLW